MQTEHLNMLVLDDDLPQAVPCPAQQSSQIDTDMPDNYHQALGPVLKDHEALFRCQLGKTNVANHVIVSQRTMETWGFVLILFNLTKGLLPCTTGRWAPLKLGGKKLFSKIDLQSAHWQFPMSESLLKILFSVQVRVWFMGIHCDAIWVDWSDSDMPTWFGWSPEGCKDCVDNYVDDCIVFLTL